MGTERLFQFKAFDFGDVWGNSVVSSGNKESSFICLDGLRASNYGYKEESAFWVFHDQLKDIADQNGQSGEGHGFTRGMGKKGRLKGKQKEISNNSGGMKFDYVVKINAKALSRN